MLVPTSQLLHKDQHQGEERPSTAVDKERLDAGKQALKQLLNDRRKKKTAKLSWFGLLRLYFSVIGGLMMCVGLIVLLFLVPMTIDPAWATITYEFEPTPVLCIVTDVTLMLGIANITWCSCMEGCTKEIFRCHQISIAYKRLTEEVSTIGINTTNNYNKLINTTNLQIDNLPKSDDEISSSVPSIVINRDLRDSYNSYEGDLESSWSNNMYDATEGELDGRETVYDESFWDVFNASLLVNVKGCGYPPKVNCTTFKESYAKVGRRFMGYYSKRDPYTVLSSYDPKQAEKDLFDSLVWTFGIQVGGFILVVVMNFPYSRLFRWIFCIKDLDNAALENFKSVAQHYGAMNIASNVANVVARAVDTHKNTATQSNHTASTHTLINNSITNININTITKDNSNSSSGVSSIGSNQVHNQNFSGAGVGVGPGFPSVNPSFQPLPTLGW